MSSEELFRNLNDYDVVSFDIFDTLLLRPVLNPRDLWVQLGGEAFAQTRQAVDRGWVDSIEDAYALIADQWKSYKARELETERKVLVANPEMLEIWELAGRLGKKRVIVSDMYLPCNFIVLD